MKAKQANRILRGGHFFSSFDSLVRIDEEEYKRQVDIQSRYFIASIPNSYEVGSFMCNPKIMSHLFGRPTNIKNHYLHWHFGGTSWALKSGMEFNNFEYEGDVLIPVSIVDSGSSDYDRSIHNYTIGAHDKLSKSCVEVIVCIVTTHLLTK